MVEALCSSFKGPENFGWIHGMLDQEILNGNLANPWPKYKTDSRLDLPEIQILY